MGVGVRAGSAIATAGGGGAGAVGATATGSGSGSRFGSGAGSSCGGPLANTSSRPRASRFTSTAVSGGTCSSRLTSESVATISIRSSFAGVAASSAGSNPFDGVHEKRRPPANCPPKAAFMTETLATPPSRCTATIPGVPVTATRTASFRSVVVR